MSSITAKAPQLLQQQSDLGVAWIVRRRYADERDTGRSGTAGIIYRVAQVPERLAGILVLNQVKTIRSGLRIRN